MRFQGKIAIVTGAGQGIGKATALCLSREGASVVLVDRAERECRAVAKEIVDGGGQAHVVVADLETAAGARDMVEETVSLHGRIDVSVHNVGGTIWIKPFWEYTDEQIEREIKSLDGIGTFPDRDLAAGANGDEFAGSGLQPAGDKSSRDTAPDRGDERVGASRPRSSAASDGDQQRIAALGSVPPEGGSIQPRPKPAAYAYNCHRLSAPTHRRVSEITQSSVLAEAGGFFWRCGCRFSGAGTVRSRLSLIAVGF